MERPKLPESLPTLERSKLPTHWFDRTVGDIVKPKHVEASSNFRRHFVAAAGEFVGTFLFLFFAFLAHAMVLQQAPDHGPDGTKSSTTIVYIALSYSMSLLISAWTLYRVSGGLFNPAVTIGLILTRTLPPVRGLILMPVQFLGATCAAAVAAVIVPGGIEMTKTALAPEMSVTQGLFLEMLMTFQLVFSILMLAAEKSKDTFMAPIGIGLAQLIIVIAGGYYTGASVNPARSFGPCLVTVSFQSYHWIYWLGPLLGSVFAAGFYHFMKVMIYEESNPGQDSEAPGVLP